MSAIKEEEALVDYEADEEEEEEEEYNQNLKNGESSSKKEAHDDQSTSSDSSSTSSSSSESDSDSKRDKQSAPKVKAKDQTSSNDKTSQPSKDEGLVRNSTTPKPKPSVSSATASHGVYIPPFRRRQMEELKKQQEEAAAKARNDDEDGEIKPAFEAVSMNDQRQKWEDLKKAINGTINRLNNSTIKELIHSLFQNANLIRGKGLLAKSLIRAATTSPSYAPVYASLLAVVNTKLPEIGELILVRSILTFRKSYARQDRSSTMSITNFIGCLFNQGLCHELLCLQLLTVLLDGDPTDDSVEVAVQLTKVVGMALSESSPAGIHAVMERFRNLLHDGSIGRRVEYRIEELMNIRKKRFKDYPALIDELDLVEREEQIVFEIGLDDEGLQKEGELDMFKFDENYVENEHDWIAIQKEILGGDSDDEDETDDSNDSETDDDSDDDDSDDDDDNEDGVLKQAPPARQISKQIVTIQDMTEKDLINLRRKIYLTIMSSATFEECAHKLAKLDIPPGKEMELINMIIECCSQERTFLRYYGLISSRFCLLDRRWNDAFLEAFQAQYTTIHRLETNKLRNVAKLFAHLLHTDSLPWSCLSVIHLNEDETTSSSRIFLKILVQEMAEAIGIGGLVKRFESDDPETMVWYQEMFPKDNPRKTRYAINFFTSIGLGPLTDGLREHLKNAPKLIMMQAEAEARRKAMEDDSSDDSSSVSSTSSSSTSSVSSSSSSSVSSSSSYTSTSSSSYSSTSSSSDESSVSSRGKRRSRGNKRDKNKSSNRSRTEKKHRRDRSRSRSESVSVKDRSDGDKSKRKRSSSFSSRSRSKESDSKHNDDKKRRTSKRSRRDRSESSYSSRSESDDDRKAKRKKSKR